MFNKNLRYFKDAPKLVNEIRMQSVDYILTDWERFFPYIKTNLATIVKGFSLSGSNVAKDKEVYSKYMTQNKKIGTFTELIAAAEHFPAGRRYV